MTTPDDNRVWLTINFFCAQPCWNNLLKQIEAYLLNYKEVPSSQQSYYLEFYSSNEYLSFSWLILTDEYTQIETDIKNEFYSFNPIITTSFKLSSVTHYQLPVSISRAIIEALKNEAVTHEAILTFSFHLYIGFLRALINNQISLNAISNLIGYKNQSVSGYQYTDLLEAQFQNNKEHLITISNEILNNEPQGWLKQWINDCAYQLIQKSEYPPNVNLLYIYNRIIYTIFKHLSLDSSQEMLLSYFVQQIINRLSILTITNAI